MGEGKVLSAPLSSPPHPQAFPLGLLAGMTSPGTPAPISSLTFRDPFPFPISPPMITPNSALPLPQNSNSPDSSPSYSHQNSASLSCISPGLHSCGSAFYRGGPLKNLSALQVPPSVRRKRKQKAKEEITPSYSAWVSLPQSLEGNSWHSP